MIMNNGGSNFIEKGNYLTIDQGRIDLPKEIKLALLCCENRIFYR